MTLTKTCGRNVKQATQMSVLELVNLHSISLIYLLAGVLCIFSKSRSRNVFAVYSLYLTIYHFPTDFGSTFAFLGPLFKAGMYIFLGMDQDVYSKVAIHRWYSARIFLIILSGLTIIRITAFNYAEQYAFLANIVPDNEENYLFAVNVLCGSAVLMYNNPRVRTSFGVYLALSVYRETINSFLEVQITQLREYITSNTTSIPQGVLLIGSGIEDQLKNVLSWPWLELITAVWFLFACYTDTPRGVKKADNRRKATKVE